MVVVAVALIRVSGVGGLLDLLDVVWVGGGGGGKGGGVRALLWGGGGSGGGGGGGGDGSTCGFCAWLDQRCVFRFSSWMGMFFGVVYG